MPMNKFQKRLSKVLNNCENAVVIGRGFGHLAEIVELFKTVFVFDKTLPEIKSKNLVYRENFDNLSQISEVSVVLFDLLEINRLEEVSPIWHRNKAVIVIEGNEPIDRTLSKSLYASSYECTGLYKTFHTWELKK
jgi:hypothetical protein